MSPCLRISKKSLKRVHNILGRAAGCAVRKPTTFLAARLLASACKSCKISKLSLADFVCLEGINNFISFRDTLYNDGGR